MTNRPRSAGLGNLNKIRKLANERGTPLLDVKFGALGKRKSIHFHYRVGQGIIVKNYPSVLKGITGELRRLAR